MKKVVFASICIGCVTVLFLQVQKMRSAQRPGKMIGEFNVVYFEKGTNLEGTDELLRPYYQIAHHSKEGGRAYFSFPEEELTCLNPRQAQAELAQNNISNVLSYSGSQGKACIFLNPEKYAWLINLLEQQPPVSRFSYGANNSTLVKTWHEATEKLNKPFNRSIQFKPVPLSKEIEK